MKLPRTGHTHTHVLHIHTMRTRFGQSCCGTLAKVGPTGAAEHIYVYIYIFIIS